MHFNQARKGRLPRAGRTALCGCVIGVGLSQLLYPTVGVDLRPPAKIGPSGDRILMINKTLLRNHSKVLDAPIRVVKVRGETGKEAEARMLWAVRYLMGIAEGGCA